MQHPFINDLSDLSMEELQQKISDLNNKLNYAYRTGKGPLIHQLGMVIESYRHAYNNKITDMISKQNLKTQIKVEKN